MAGQMATSWEWGRGLGPHGGQGSCPEAPLLPGRDPVAGGNAWVSPGWDVGSVSRMSPSTYDSVFSNMPGSPRVVAALPGAHRGQACPTDPWLSALPPVSGSQELRPAEHGCCRQPREPWGCTQLWPSSGSLPIRSQGTQLTTEADLGVCSPRVGAEAVRLRGWALVHWTLTLPFLQGVPHGAEAGGARTSVHLPCQASLQYDKETEPRE